MFWANSEFERAHIKKHGWRFHCNTITFRKPKLPITLCSTTPSDNYMNIKAYSWNRWSHSSVQWKIILKVSMRLSFQKKIFRKFSKMLLVYKRMFCYHPPQGFPNSINWWGDAPNLVWANQKFCMGRIFLLGGESLMRSEFDHTNLFQGSKQHSVNIEHWLHKHYTPVCRKIWRWNKSGTGTTTTAKNEVFIGLKHEKIVI